jgi:hypothetical protein
MVSLASVRLSRVAASITLAACASAFPARAGTVRLRPVTDTTIFEAAPTNNLGGVVSLAAGTTARSRRSRALLRFDLVGNIPSNATIVAATLTLSVVRAPSGGGGVDSTFQLYRVLRAWTEGSKTTGTLGAPASSGEPTWLARAHPFNAWSQPGAAAPLDFAATPTASQFVGGLGSYDFGDLASDVELWRMNPAGNFGWILLSQDEITQATARRFGAREDTNNSPELLIEFTRPFPPAPRILGAQRLRSGLRFVFEAQPNVTYTVEHRPAPAFGLWTALTNIAPDAVLRNVVVSDVPGGSDRFYRVVAH